MALSERRQMLSGLVNADAGVIRLSEEIEGDGDTLLAAACEHGLEGIIGKKLDTPYHSDRRGDWVKIKCIQSDSFFIVGYEPSAAALGGIGRLLLAARQGNDAPILVPQSGSAITVKLPSGVIVTIPS
jgi:bifunctional non-homologous end joining protein LigD